MVACGRFQLRRARHGHDFARQLPANLAHDANSSADSFSHRNTRDRRRLNAAV
jgi:hypothetical protein